MATGATAEAQHGGWKIFGTWRSTSGNLFVVSSSGHGGLSLNWIQPSGQQTLIQGRWVQGLRGTQFQYWDHNGYAYTGTFSTHDPNRIRIVASTGAVSWWTRHVATLAPEPAPYPRPMPRVHYPRRMPCWSPNDPGCGRTRNGYAAMGGPAFAGFLGMIRAARPHVFSMKDRVQAGIANQYLTSAQLVRVLAEFRPHVFPMLEVVKICAPRVVDPENGVGGVSLAFSPHTMVGTQAATVLASQRGDHY